MSPFSVQLCCFFVSRLYIYIYVILMFDKAKNKKRQWNKNNGRSTFSIFSLIGCKRTKWLKIGRALQKRITLVMQLIAS